MQTIRKIGGMAVLPVEKIKNTCRKVLVSKDLDIILDFGAGALFWTDWFIREFKAIVCKVHDIFPEKIIEILNSSGFEVTYHYMPKIWYPHFILIADKNGA